MKLLPFEVTKWLLVEVHTEPELLIIEFLDALDQVEESFEHFSTPEVPLLVSTALGRGHT